MERLTKGTIAAGAAVLLLLGTGGTLAYWNDTLDVGVPTVITAGNLVLDVGTAPTWSISHGDGDPVPVTDISAVRIVPGDTLIFSGVYEITAEGGNLAFTASVAPGSIEAASAADEDVALAGRIEDSATFTINGVAGATATIEHLDDAVGTYDVEIDVTLAWPFDGDPEDEDNPAKTGQVNLTQFAVSVEQIEATTP